MKPPRKTNPETDGRSPPPTPAARTAGERRTAHKADARVKEGSAGLPEPGRPRKAAAVSAPSGRVTRSNGDSAATKRVRATTAAPAAPAPDAPPTAASAPCAMARVPMTVRWGDLDAFNHVNNATFLVYAQEARLAWLAEVKGNWFDDSMMPVVAAAQLNFRRQLAWPARIMVELSATRIGTSSLTIAHRIVAVDDPACVYADGEVVMVWIDPANGRSVPLPEAIRAACATATAPADQEGVYK